MAHKTSSLFKFLAVVAAINIAWLISTSATELPQSVEMQKFRIAVALVISAVAAWPRKAIGLWVSFVALMWIAFEYVLWWRGSRIAIEAAGSSFSRNPHLAYFLHARWWDLVVLLLTVVGLFWSSGYLINLLTHREKVGSR